MVVAAFKQCSRMVGMRHYQLSWEFRHFSCLDKHHFHRGECLRQAGNSITSLPTSSANMPAHVLPVSSVKHLHTTWTLREPSVYVDPKSTLADDDLNVRISGLESGQEVELKASVWSECERYRFESSAVYRANDSGDIAVKTDPSLGGSYEGIEPHGLIWSLVPAPEFANKYPRLVKFDITTPFVFALDVIDNGPSRDGDRRSASRSPRVIASTTMERWYLADYVERIPTKMKRAEGVWFIPKHKGHSDPLPVVLDVRGIVSSLVVDRAAILASHGFAVFAYDYFHPIRRETKEENIYLELAAFEEIVEYIENHPRLDASRIGLTCNCIGGALSLHAVSRLQLPIRCLVAMGFFDTTFPTVGFLAPDGKKLQPMGDYFEVWQDDEGRWWAKGSVHNWNFSEDIEQVAPVENINFPMMLFEHGDEVHLEVRGRVQKIVEKMERVGKGHLVQRYSLPGTGHLPDTPYLPSSPISGLFVPGHKQLYLTAFGGYDARQNSRDQAFAWRKILRFFNENLDQRELYRHDWL